MRLATARSQRPDIPKRNRKKKATLHDTTHTLENNTQHLNILTDPNSITISISTRHVNRRSRISNPGDQPLELAPATS